MPRRPHPAPSGTVYHVLNRANGRSELFKKPEDYAAVERIMIAAIARSLIRLLAAPGIQLESTWQT
jgi:putative transposase